MKNFKDSITNIFENAIKSFSRFPTSIISAIIIAVVALIKITRGYEVDSSVNFLLDITQYAFLIGGVFAMFTVTYAEIKHNDNKQYFLYANASGFIVAIISFILLYFFGSAYALDSVSITNYISTIAFARVLVATFVSATLFVYMISKSKTINNFSDAFFITHKAFVISMIYALVMLIGISGVIGAFQALLYKDLSYKVYQFVQVGIGLVTYTIFLGYFPSFKETTLVQDSSREEISVIGKEDLIDEVAVLKEQPRFIHVLFGNILVPIMLALTVVLLIWSVQVLFKGVNVSFTELSSITTSFVLIGIWIHIMVANHDSKITNFYRTAYPVSAILILALQAWALYGQITKFGVKTTEYAFAMIWIFALISVVMMIVLKSSAYRKIAIVAIVISIFWVLPIVGYQDFTFNNQISASTANFIGQDLYQSGRVAAKLMHSICNVGDIAIVHIDEKFKNAVHMQEKEKGFRSYFEDLDGFQNNIIKCKLKYGEKDEKLSHFLDKHSNLTGVFVTNSKAFHVARVLQSDTKNHINLVGYDLLSENVAYLKSGVIDFLIHQNPRQQAYLGMKFLIEHLVFEKQIPDQFLLPIDIINSENVTPFLRS